MALLHAFFSNLPQEWLEGTHLIINHLRPVTSIAVLRIAFRIIGPLLPRLANAHALFSKVYKLPSIISYNSLYLCLFIRVSMFFRLFQQIVELTLIQELEICVTWCTSEPFLFFDAFPSTYTGFSLSYCVLVLSSTL